MRVFKNKIWQFIKRNIRYAIVFAVMLVALYFGKNIGPIAPFSYPSQSAAADSIEKNNVVVKKDNFYQISFTAEAEENKSDTEFYKTTSDGDTTIPKVPLSICLYKNNGDRSCQKDLSIELSGKYHTIFSRFKAADDFSKITVERSELNKSRVVYFKNIDLEQLNVNNQSEFNSLAPSIAGNSGSDVTVNSNVPENSKPIANLKSKQMKVGQIFIANSTNITGVEFQPKVVGSGGDGQMSVELRTANFSNGKYEIGNLISNYDFNVQQAVFDSSKDGLLRIPLGGLIKKGSYYYIGVDNAAAIFTNTNFLQLTGTSCSKTEVCAGIEMLRSGKIKQVGNLWFNIYSANDTYDGAHKILNGAIVQDLGNGVGKYTYSLQGNQYDILDIDQITTDDQVNNRVNYAQALGAVVGVGPGNLSYTYRVDTVYPAKNLSINAQKIENDDSDIEISTSLDGVTWKKMDHLQSNQGVTFTGNFENLVDGLIYIKIAKKSSNASSNIFGLAKLDITADLILK